MEKNRITVAAIQHGCSMTRDNNLERSANGIRKAASEGAKLVLLQELHASLYFPQSEDSSFFDIAEPLPGPTSDFLSELACSLNIVIVGSVFERRAAGVYHNTAIVLETDGSLAGYYRKMHIPDDPGYYEKYYFTPGDTGFVPITTSVGKLGVLVCWDQWYPEAARLMALQGADILLYPTAIGWDPADDAAEQQRQKDAWTVIQRSHAIANNLPVISANRVGHETDNSGQTGGIRFWGGSFICGQQGEILAQCGANDDDICIAELDLARSESTRRTWPYLRDRRIDAYDGLLKRYIDE